MEINSQLIQSNIEKAKKGDQVAFTFLLDFFWNEVYGFMLKRTQNETDTEDIVIETFAKAFDRIATYNPDYAFNTWLIAIAKNAHIDMLRKKKSSLFIDINEDANLEAWDDTVKKLMEKYPNIAYVIPGHFRWSKGKESLKHTIELLQNREED